MWFKAFLEVLLLPPVSLVFLILAGVAGQGWAPRLGRWLAGLGAVLLLALSLPLVSDTLLCSLETGLPLTPPPGKPPGAIVILGGDEERLAGPSDATTVGHLSLERLRAGAALWRRTHLPVLLSGGVIGDKGPPLADLMAGSLQGDFQVPVRWVEEHSLDTWQNAFDSAAILRANGITSVYVVTHAWHERRALMAFARTGLTATAAPVFLDRPPDPEAADFVPRVSAWLTSYYALHEWIGCAWYALP